MRAFGHGRAGAWLLALSLAGCALGPVVTPHDDTTQAGIDQAQKSLDGLRGLKAHFVQIGPGNAGGTGTAWFETGHLRLQYDTPSRRVVVATRGRLIIRDEATSSITRISLAANPLGLLLSGPVHLSGEIDVTDLQQSAGALQLSLARTSNPAQGLLTLFFARAPDGALHLSGLEAVDAERHRTHFLLSDRQEGLALDPSLFTLPG